MNTADQIGFGSILAAAPLASNDDAGALAGLFARMLDEIDYGMALISASGELRYANQLARRALSGAVGLVLEAGVVHATDAAQQPLLRQAIVEAGRGLRRMLTLAGNDRRAAVALVPLAAGDGDDGDALVMLVFGKQPASETLTLDFFARSHRLTAAESAVLHGLCAGERPKEIAQKVGVAISTVRTQIGSIRIKTQTGSIRDLVNRVATLPPITPAMKSALCH
jgi:DNA-binding CsgD family transcriptional regulator